LNVPPSVIMRYQLRWPDRGPTMGGSVRPDDSVP
jgi:hypothetical protein